MSYTPTTWVTGDPITATKLNKLENGVANAGSALIVSYNAVTGALDKTVQEIYDAITSGVPAYLQYVYGDIENPNDYYSAHAWNCPISEVYRYNTDVFRVSALRIMGDYSWGNKVPAVMVFSASSMSSYPEFYYNKKVTTSSME